MPNVRSLMFARPKVNRRMLRDSKWITRFLNIKGKELGAFDKYDLAS